MKKNLKDLWSLFFTFFKIGAFTFGGGLAMISLMNDIIVTKKKWITSQEMLDLVAISESTPGPIAINSATFIGYKRGGILGGIFATLGAITPSIIIISLISVFYDKFIQIELVNKAFKGIMAAVIVLLINAVIKLSKELKNSGVWYINLILILLTITLRLFLDFNTILLVLIGGVIGFIIYTYILIKKEGNNL